MIILSRLPPASASCAAAPEQAICAAMTSKTDAEDAPPRRYHHGDLAEALVAAAVEIIEEKGVEQLSMREAARRAGVSPGAPFRHFRSKTALLTALAEQAGGRLTEAVAAALAEAGEADPLAAFEAIGVGYLRWALKNPTHFQIVSSRALVDFEGSEILRGQNAAIRRRMVGLLEAARRQGRLAEDLKLEEAMLSARALVYGLARMAADGHLPEWSPAAPMETAGPEERLRGALRLFMGALAPKG